jgi:hypothetical protein
MITPGPVVITAAFIGYLVAGLVGGAAAAAAVFAPLSRSNALQAEAVTYTYQLRYQVGRQTWIGRHCC